MFIFGQCLIFSLIFWSRVLCWRSNPHFAPEPVKVYSARRGPSGKVGWRFTLQSLESKASHGRKTWLKDLSETSMKKNAMTFFCWKRTRLCETEDLHPLLHMTGPTGMKVEYLPINKARKWIGLKGQKKRFIYKSPTFQIQKQRAGLLWCLPAVRVEESRHPGPGGLNMFPCHLND